MQSRRAFRVGMLCSLIATVLLATLPAVANNGREFSGYFDVSGVSEQGDLVQVTLHLKLFNHGNADARNVIVTLMDSSPSPMLQGNFQPVKVWKTQRFIEMSQEFTISKHEFNQWLTTPIQPNLVILFQDAKGQTWQKGAQISHRPLVRVAQ